MILHRTCRRAVVAQILIFFVSAAVAGDDPIPPGLNHPHKAFTKYPDAPDGYYWYFWWKKGQNGGESELWQVLLPGGRDVDKCAKYLAEQFLKDHWQDFTKGAEDSKGFPGIKFQDSDLTKAIAGIENMTAIPDNIFDALSGGGKTQDGQEVSGWTNEHYDPPVSYIRSSLLNEDEATIAHVLDHEAMHQAFTTAGDISDDPNSHQEQWITSYLDNNRVSEFARSHPCPQR